MQGQPKFLPELVSTLKFQELKLDQVMQAPQMELFLACWTLQPGEVLRLVQLAFHLPPLQTQVSAALLAPLRLHFPTLIYHQPGLLCLLLCPLLSIIQHFSYT